MHASGLPSGSTALQIKCQAPQSSQVLFESQTSSLITRHTGPTGRRWVGTGLPNPTPGHGPYMPPTYNRALKEKDQHAHTICRAGTRFIWGTHSADSPEYAILQGPGPSRGARCKLGGTRCASRAWPLGSSSVQGCHAQSQSAGMCTQLSAGAAQPAQVRHTRVHNPQLRLLQS